MTRPARVSACPTTWKRPRAALKLFPFAPALLFLAAPARPVPVPRRIVSLAPHLTEIVFALGAGDRLVGVSEASDFPPEARRLPRVGGVAPDLELIVSLSPDLVLASREDNPAGALASLSRLGVPVLTTETPDLPAIAGNVRSIGERLGAGDRGRKLARDLERRRALVRPPPGRHLSAVILVWADPPQAAGRGTFADDLLRRAGASNIVTRPAACG